MGGRGGSPTSRLTGIILVEWPSTGRGEVTERFKVTVLKTVVGRLTASSNLALSAKLKRRPLWPSFLSVLIWPYRPVAVPLPKLLRMKSRIAYASSATTTPTTAYRIVFLAALTLLAFPPEIT